MSRLINNIFIKEAYETNGRANYVFMASVLETLKMTQYKYKREDVAKLYRFLADIVEHGNFDWPGKFDLKPAEKNATIEPKETEKEVASVS